MSRTNCVRATVLAATALTGCLEEQRYHVVDEVVELTADAVPAYVTEADEPVYRVDRAFTLRITPPTADQLTQLAARAQGTRYPRQPWVMLHDLELQLDYVLTNDSDDALTPLVTINGINEFQYYAPSPESLHQWERRLAVAPHQRISGTITELELDEVAVDLATVLNGAPNSNLVVDRNSQSGRDPRVQAFIPDVIPGLVGVRAGLETTVAQHVILEVTIRVQDHGERAAHHGQRAWRLPDPAPFTPIVAER
jgi:hypothetical protein